MRAVTVPRCVLSGVRDNVGTTLLTLGILTQLRKQGMSVSACVVGSHLQRAVVLRRLCGRYVQCLDSRLLKRDEVLTCLYLASLGANFILITGGGGVFDGWQPASLEGSPAQIAAYAKAPVVLVADARGFGNSLSALVKGYTSFARGVSIEGVILNRVGAKGEPERPRSFFQESFAYCKLPEILGMAPDREFSGYQLAHGAAQHQNTILFPRDFFIEVAALVANHVDLDRLMAVAAQSQPLEGIAFDVEPSHIRTRIAVSDDVCFSLSFQSNLELLRYFGAKLVSFSPLADVRLPHDIGGVYLTGAFLSEYGRDLQANREMLAALRDFAAAGGVIYSEGSGSAYLCREYQTHATGEFFEGVGIIPAVARGREPEECRGRAEILEDSVLGPIGTEIAGVDPRQWALSQIDEGLLPALRMNSEQGEMTRDGYSPGAQILCTFSLLDMASQTQAALHLVNACEVVRRVE